MPETSPAETGINRRQILVGSAVAVPAIVLSTSIPARATSANSTFTLTLGATGIGTGSPVDVTATVLDSRGDPWAGQVVTFTTSDPAALSLSSSSAVTDSAGRATVSVSAASNATAGTRSITAASGPLSTSAAIDVIAIAADVLTSSTPWSVAISPLGDVAVTGHYANGTFTKISTSANQSSATIPATVNALGVAISGDGSFALAASSNGGVLRINLATNAVETTISLSPGYPYGVGISPNQAFAYVTAWAMGGTGTVSRLELATNAVTHTISFPGAPQIVSIAPNGLFAYVIDSTSLLHRIDTTSNTIVATTPITSAFGVAISPDSSFAYVTARNGFVHRVDTSTNAVVESIPTPGDAVGIDISSDGSFACSTHPDANVVRRIDTSTNTVTATIPISGRPLFVAISPDDSFAYVTRNTAASVARIEWN